MDLTRARILKTAVPRTGPVVYWMSRDQRVKDNWALLYAQHAALRSGSPLGVVFCIVPFFLNAGLRQYTFMLQGLREVEQSLRRKHIPFFLLLGQPEKEVPRFIASRNAALLVTDIDPLRIKGQWKNGVARRISIPFHEVDAHNIVPCWIASTKQEFGAYTIRPKINRLLDDYLTEFPSLKRHPHQWAGKQPTVNWKKVLPSINTDTAVPPVDWIRPGEKAAGRMLQRFIRQKLSGYSEKRNDPTLDGQSNLSPYLHFGQVSAQRIALEVRRSEEPRRDKAAFLEELIVRRELSDNFCFYNDHYDDFDGFPNWAKATLNAHRKDKREYIYSRQQFEKARTHDPLWNAAQREMMKRGKMHGYMRMYWAKKILEWTRSPEEAMKIAVYLNDTYELDGRDPNGYAGIAGSIGGVHDRAWGERPIFGKVRFMTYNGARTKFDVEGYIENVKRL